MLTSNVFSNKISLNSPVPAERRSTRKGMLNLFFIDCNAHSEEGGIIKKRIYGCFRKNMFTEPARNFKTKKPPTPCLPNVG